MLEIAKLTHKAKILIVEGFNVKKIGWQKYLKQNNDFNFVGVANSTNDALYFMEIFKPDVIIVDLTHMGTKGIDTIQKIKETEKNIKLIVLSSAKKKEEIISSIRSGANAYCLSDISTETLSIIIKTVAMGACWFDPVAVPTLLSCFPKPKKEVIEEPLIAPLSERELEVLKLVVLGKSNTMIAEELIVSVHTAKAHVCNILHKMQVSDRVQAAVKAMKLGLVTP